MKIFVCIKQVPDTETKIKIKPDGAGLDPFGVSKWVLNPYDEFAVEEAVKFRETNPGAQVFVLTVGPKERAADALRTALAMGADEALLVHAPDPLDANMTAKALAEAIKKEGGAQLIFTGKLSIDANQSSVGQMVAELLSIPHASVISKTQYSADSVLADRDVEGGTKEKIKLSRPCLLAANKGLNTPRYASLPGIMKAKKKVIKEYDLPGLGVTEADRRIQFQQFSLPQEKPAAKILSGDSAAQVGELVKLLRDEAKAL